MTTRDDLITDLTAFDNIRDHRTGTAGDRETSQWLIDQCTKAGSTAALREFPFARRDIREARVEFADRSVIEGVPLFDAMDTRTEGIEGLLGAFGSEAELGITPFSPQGRVSATQTLDEIRRSTNHAGLIAVSNVTGLPSGIALQNAEHYGTPFGPPTLCVAPEEAGRLADAAKAAVKTTLFISSRWENTHGTNVDLLIEGKDPSLAPVVIYTPKSAWWTCTAERGGGLVVWLALMRHFAANQPARNVHFTANSGHELGHLGMRWFLAGYPKLANDAAFWLHLGANFAAKDSRLLLQSDSAERLQPLRTALEERGITGFDVMPHGNRPLGEARNIHDKGGRYLSLLGDNRWFHHPSDRLDVSVDIGRIATIVDAFLNCIPALTNS